MCPRFQGGEQTCEQCCVYIAAATVPVSVCVCQLWYDLSEADLSSSSEGVGAIVCGGGGVRPTSQQLADDVTARHSTAQHAHSTAHSPGWQAAASIPARQPASLSALCINPVMTHGSLANRGAHAQQAC